MKQLFTFSFCWLSLWLQAQTTSKLLLNSGISQPLVILMDESERPDVLLKSVESLAQEAWEQPHFLLIYGAKLDTTSIAKMINDLLNSSENARFFDKKKIYLLMLKTDPVVRNCLTNKLIFADVETYPATENEAPIPLAPILERFRSKYLWQIDVSDIEMKNIKITEKTNRLGLGLVFGSNTQNIFKEDTAFLPGKILKYGILLNYKLTNRIQLAGKLMGSFKIPNQKKLQSSVLNQLDISAGGEQTIRAEMEFHMYIEAALQANYFFTLRKRFQGFAGIGITQISFNSARSTIEQTIDVSNFSPGSGGGAPDGLDFNNGGDDFPKLSHKFVYPFLSCGLSYALTPRMNVIFNANYQITNHAGGIVNGVVVNQKMNPITFNVGVQFSFRISKVYYQYLNANRKIIKSKGA